MTLTTKEISAASLQEAKKAFKKAIPPLVRISTENKTTKQMLCALRDVICPDEGPIHDSPLDCWLDWAERKPEE